MSAHMRVLFAAATRQRRLLWLAVAGLITVLAQGCSGAVIAPPWASPDPSDAFVRVPPANYRSTTGAYVSQRPVEPRSWREQNQRVAPTPKQ